MTAFKSPSRALSAGVVLITMWAVSGCGGSGAQRPVQAIDVTRSASPVTSAAPLLTEPTEPATSTAQTGQASSLLPGMPAPLSATDVYAADRAGQLSAEVADDPARVYVPNSRDNTVTVIDQKTMTVIGHFPTGVEPQHVVPSYDLKTLYAIADNAPGSGAGFTPIDPKTSKPGAFIPITDPYNLYFTPDGQYGIVVAEYYQRLDFYDPHTWKLHDSLNLPGCAGVDHMDFSADGKLLLASCEFANRLVVVDVASHQVVRAINLTRVPGGMPQDVKLSPDGKTFYIADMMANGVYLVDGQGKAVEGFVPTGKGTHGLYVDRTSTRLFITNRGAGTISVLDLATRAVTTTWKIPGGGSPDMGNLSADGEVFWISGRYDGVVYAISTVDGHLIKKIPVGNGPHGLAVWPQPGRYSLGHTGILR